MTVPGSRSLFWRALGNVWAAPECPAVDFDKAVRSRRRSLRGRCDKRRRSDLPWCRYA